MKLESTSKALKNKRRLRDAPIIFIINHPSSVHLHEKHVFVYLHKCVKSVETAHCLFGILSAHLATTQVNENDVDT